MTVTGDTVYLVSVSVSWGKRHTEDKYMQNISLVNSISRKGCRRLRIKYNNISDPKILIFFPTKKRC